MNINLYLEDSLAAQLNQYVKQVGKPRNAILREAIKEWISSHQKKTWPKSILRFKGCPEMPPFESYRDELLPLKEDPFA